MTNKTFINLNKKKQQLEFINILQDMVNLYADKRNEINYIVSPEEQKKFNQIFYTINYIDSLDVSCSKKSESASEMTLKEFNKLYLGKAVHCKTEELANEFLELADSFGYKWVSGHKLTSFNEWDAYKDKTCYEVDYHDKDVFYGNINDIYLPIIEFKGVRK